MGIGNNTSVCDAYSISVCRSTANWTSKWLMHGERVIQSSRLHWEILRIASSGNVAEWRRCSNYMPHKIWFESEIFVQQHWSDMTIFFRIFMENLFSDNGLTLHEENTNKNCLIDIGVLISRRNSKELIEGHQIGSV